MLVSWETLEQVFLTQIRETAPCQLSHSREFALGRLAEGQALVQYFTERLSGSATIVDIGAGNGGISLALANVARFRVLSVDTVINSDLLAMRRRTGLPARQIVADAAALPLRSGVADVVLCLELIEHVPRPERTGTEVMRVLNAGGTCMLTTPARLRHLLRRDPHYGIRGLLLLPKPFQKLAARLARGVKNYDVVHTFWHANEVTDLFPGDKDVEIVWDKLPPFPDRIRTRIWWALRFFLWNRIVMRKAVISQP